MMMPGRKYQAGSEYRYGFNGKELDKEDPIQYDYGFRIYDPRLVRFKSVDPLSKEFPWNSSYAFAENDLIRSIDLEGAEKYIVTGRIWYNSDGKQLQNLHVTTLPKPGPLGSGTLAMITVDKKTYTPNGVIGNQFNVTQYIPAKEDKKSSWESFWYKTLNGGASDNYGGGSGSNQNFGIISVSENDWGATKSGTKHNAVFFEVTETGISDLTGNVREFGPLSKKGEIFKQELTELKVFLMNEKDLIPIAGKVSDAISKSFGTIDNLSDGTNHFQENIISSYSNKKPEIPVYSNGASSTNRLSGPSGSKGWSSG